MFTGTVLCFVESQRVLDDNLIIAVNNCYLPNMRNYLLSMILM